MLGLGDATAVEGGRDVVLWHWYGGVGGVVDMAMGNEVAVALVGRDKVGSGLNIGDCGTRVDRGGAGRSALLCMYVRSDAGMDVIGARKVLLLAVGERAGMDARAGRGDFWMARASCEMAQAGRWRKARRVYPHRTQRARTCVIARGRQRLRCTQRTVNWRGPARPECRNERFAPMIVGCVYAVR